MAPEERQFEFGVTPQAGGSLRVPGGRLCETRVERGGGALVRRPRYQPVPAAHQTLVRKVHDRVRRERDRRGRHEEAPTRTPEELDDLRDVRFGRVGDRGQFGNRRWTADAAWIGERVGERLQDPFGDRRLPRRFAVEVRLFGVQ